MTSFRGRPWSPSSSVSALLCALLVSACGPDGYRGNTPGDFNVVLVTLDGVRWQELFDGADPLLAAQPEQLFPIFWEKLAARGTVYGDPHHGSVMTVANAANASLPGYTSLYAETNQGCLTNFCARVSVPTFVDRLHDELLIPKQDLAVFASWWKMSLAVTGRDDVATVRVGQSERADPRSPQRALLNDTFEFDRGTVVNGFQYLGAQRPRYLHLGFLDSDRFGHQDRYDKYAAVLRSYDRLLGELVERLDAAGEYGRKTALIVTTDHGRGLWEQWREHGPQTPASARVWAFVMLPRAATGLSLVEPDARPFDHHDVRYTIETLLGLGTRSSSGYSTGFIRSPDARLGP